MKALFSGNLIKSTDPKVVKFVYRLNIFIFPVAAILYTIYYVNFPIFEPFYYSNALFQLPKLYIDEKSLESLGKMEFSKYYVNYFNCLFLMYVFSFLFSLSTLIGSIFLVSYEIKKGETERLGLGIVLFVIMSGVFFILPTDFLGSEGNTIIAMPPVKNSIYIVLILFISINTLTVGLILLMAKYIKYMRQEQNGGRYG